jgi:hypothetical protein
MGENQLLGFHRIRTVAVMFQKSCIQDFFETDETGSRVLMSNPRATWLAQLVTRESTPPLFFDRESF